MTKKKIVLYDWIRLWATIWVVIGHSNYRTSDITGVYPVPENISSAIYDPVISLLGNTSNWVYGFHMALFFFLSGAVLAIRPVESFKSFAAGKIKRLVIPYYIYGLLYMIPVKMAVDYFQEYSYTDIAIMYLQGQYSGHMWFLLALFWCMMIFVLIKKRLEKLNVDNGIFLLLASVRITAVHQYIPGDFLFFKQGMQYIMWFGIGYCFEAARKKLGKKPKSTLLTVSIMVLAVAVTAEIYNMKTGALSGFAATVTGIVLSISISAFCSMAIDVTKLKGWNLIIRNLMNIYLFHDPLEYVILKYVFSNRHILTTAAGCYAYIAMRTIGVIIVSVALGEIIRYITTKIKNIKKEGEKVECHV